METPSAIVRALALVLLLKYTPSFAEFSNLVSDKTGFSGKDVTATVFGSQNKEIFPVAYADFNSDKITDIFTVSRDQSTLHIYFGHETPTPIFKPAIECTLRENWKKKGYIDSPVKIVGVVAADFNGDSILDVMITYKRSPEKVLHGDGKDCANITTSLESVIFRGNLTSLDCNVEVSEHLAILDLVDEPLALDINGDMVMDLFGEIYVRETEDVVPIPKPIPNATTTTTPSPHPPCFKTRVEKKIWLFSSSGPQVESPIRPPPALDFILTNDTVDDPNKTVNCSRPHANSFADTDGDFVPELVLVTAFEEPNGWIYQRKIYQINLDDPTVPKFRLLHNPIDIHLKTNPTNKLQVLGQPVWMDLNQEAKLLQLFPFSSTKDCAQGTNGILVVTENGSSVLPLTFDDPGNWNYVCNHQAHSYSNYTDTITLRAGDFNLDGYPDLIGILRPQGSSSLNSRAVIFENVPCQSDCPFPRTFRINFEALAQYNNVTLATFFDLHEDGLVDVIVVRRTDETTKPNKDTYSAFAFQNSPDYDANFMKVMVLSGLSCPLCPQSQTPYGNIISGPVIKYMTTTQADHFQTAVAAQFYRSSHFSMDIPYTIFGVGQSPNFIETLEISVSTEADKRVQQWQQLIPNSQIIVIPAPLDKVWLWSAKLFLTPSRAVLNTGLVLIGFCTVICLIIGGLQYKERRDDMKDRLQEAHRFHMM